MNALQEIDAATLAHEKEFLHRLPSTLAGICTEVEAAINGIVCDLVVSNGNGERHLELAGLSMAYAKCVTAYILATRA